LKEADKMGGAGRPSRGIRHWVDLLAVFAFAISAVLHFAPDGHALALPDQLAASSLGGDEPCDADHDSQAEETCGVIFDGCSLCFPVFPAVKVILPEGTLERMGTVTIPLGSASAPQSPPPKFFLLV